MRMSRPDTHGSTRSRGRADAYDPVLTAKVTVPDLPGWVVARPRIDKLIADGTRGPLTLVAGPPGAGKTMAIAAWAAAASRNPGALAWLTVDDHDNRPRVFWSYVVAALRRAGVAVPRVRFGPGRVAVDHAFLANLASALAAHDPPAVLVLDDLHLLAEPTVLDGLAYVLRNASPGLHLVVASRIDPMLPLHRYRLAGQLAEIRADDLAFSTEESALLLAHHGIALSADTLDRITGRIEGWAAGMRLAAMSLQGRDDPDQFAEELETGETAITSYLVEEVLDAQPTAVREMLLRTSILDSVNAELVGVLIDSRPDEGILPDLARANAFVRPLGQGWYRYHSLLATVLRLKLRIERRGLVPDLYRRAARWYQRNGRLDEAVGYAAESGDWPFAAGVVVDEFATAQLTEPCSHRPLAEAFQRMPRHTAWAQPQPLLVLAAAGLSRVSSDAVTTSLIAAESMLDRLPDNDEIPARLAAVQIRLALARRTGNLGLAAAAAERAEALIDQLSQEVHDRYPGIRAQMLAGCGAADLWAGRLDEAAVRFEAGVAAAPSAGHERADGLGYLALTEALAGRLSSAVVRADQAADAMSSGGDDLIEHVIPSVDVALAWVYLQRGDMQGAHARLKQAEASLRTCPDRLVSALACTVAAQLRLAEGHVSRAMEMIRQARQAWSPPAWLDLRLTILESRVCMAADDVPAALAAAQRADTHSVPEAAAALAHAWLATGDQQAARRVLDSVTENLGGTTHRLGLAGWVAEARFSYETGDGVRGRRCLERGLELAKAEQTRLPFVMEQTWLRQVLRRDPELAHHYHELVAAPVMSPGAVPFQRKAPPSDQAAPVFAERLSERECEVLTHASKMLSTAEIATEMFISVNTVKTHFRSIYRKLSATHRSEAVRRARRLQLI
jgi:LuxR family transcriptional regulator, maltose regulon positive regulatory protein